jgi:DNA-binding transcriptional ArsR family regulator
MDIFDALADTTRRKILELLASQGQLSAREIYANFNVSPPAVSQHLKVLREAGLVKMEKHAQQHIYRINPEAMLEFETWTRQLTDLWNRRLDALDVILQVEKQKGLKTNRKDELNVTRINHKTCF